MHGLNRPDAEAPHQLTDPIANAHAVRRHVVGCIAGDVVCPAGIERRSSPKCSADVDRECHVDAIGPYSTSSGTAKGVGWRASRHRSTPAERYGEAVVG